MRELFTFLLRLQEEGEVQTLIGVVLEAPISKVMEEKMLQILIGVPLEVLTSEVQEEKEKKELERELRRKEKALAEVAALLTLKKKADAIWGEREAE